MVAHSSAALVLLALEDVYVDGNFNVRIFYGDIDALALSLMTEGQREPIKVRRDGSRYLVVDGHRRHRAFERARNLSIVPREGGFFLCEEGRTLAAAPGPLHASFDPRRILCRIVDGQEAEQDIFASQLTYNSGKPFTLLERMIFLSRLSKLENSLTREQLALKTGFSRTYIANAQHLHAADPRLLDFVRDGRVSQKLALRLLRAFPAEEQVARVAAAVSVAQRRSRDKILPKDIEWLERLESARSANGKGAAERGSDPIRVRLHNVAHRLEGAERYAPNPVAVERLGTWRIVQQYAFGKVPYARLEAHLLARE